MDKPVIINFFSPNCGHCRAFAPTWDKVKEFYKDKEIIVKEVNCVAKPEICYKFGIQGYPTIQLFYKKRINEYAGRRTLEDLQQFIKNVTQ